jgi:hypothetical protein
LESARELWSVRRYPGDARLLLEAAIAAGQAGAAQPALDWIRTNRLGDARLAPLVAKLTASP